jgi:reactive intermediate/imine deaminase
LSVRADPDNPFASRSDRHAIWELLVRRDIEAFVAADWSQVADTFQENEFVGYLGSPNPDDWSIRFPTLQSYRDDWLRQAREFGGVRFNNQTLRDVLYQASSLEDIKIAGDRAAAHKKFRLSTATIENTPFVLDWQTIYWLRCDEAGWRITGFLGYLPNRNLAVGSLAPKGAVRASAIAMPPTVQQHSGAGPYSPVLEVNAGRLVVLSGQGPIDANGKIVGTTIEEQTIATLENCRRLLACAGADFAQVFRATVYLRDMNDWSRFNEVYKRYFRPPYPARSAVQAVLWGNIAVEIELTAMLAQAI